MSKVSILKWLKKNIFNKNIIKILLIFLFAAGVIMLRRPMDTVVPEKTISDNREAWVTVFVHGSFGSLLGFLNTVDVIKDNIDGTAYKKVVGKMRKDPFFYREQPLLEKGLIQIFPSYDLATTNKRKLAAYPLLKAYDDITERVAPGKEKNYFYTFGWSGLLSQKRRCLEAIRFYNSISEEIEKYQLLGINPKIRVLTHSHGGNLIAYISAIYKILEKVEFDCTKIKKPKHYEQDAFKITANWLCSLPKKGDAKKKKRGQKRWGYRPEKPLNCIDELIMWGTPVQPETDYLFASSFFKKIYHFYSEDDLVQRIDWVSTKQRYSDRRFDTPRLWEKNKSEKSRFVQSRVMVDRCFDLGKKLENKKAKKKKAESFWSVLFSGGSIVTPSGSDPTHKELWFFSWKYEDSPIREFILAPFPVSVFTPALTRLIEKSKEKNAEKDFNDFDINIRKTIKTMEFDLVKHDEESVIGKFSIEKDFLSSLKNSVSPWRSKQRSSEDLFNMLRRYAEKT
jgi:hypothetical protein